MTLDIIQDEGGKHTHPNIVDLEALNEVSQTASKTIVNELI
jgi:hypothetical protein